MKVVVFPKHPIPGILPKNKWIDEKMVLDLNRNEVMHCMKFGTVYDESGNLIDSRSIKNVPVSIIETAVTKTTPVNNNIIIENEFNTEEPSNTTITENNGPIEITVDDPEISEVVIMSPITVVNTFPESEEEIDENTVVEELPHYDLDILSCIKEDEYIILETMVDSNSKLEGNLYGLFAIISGSRPSSIEYKSGDEWRKFSSKFDNFETIENGDSFVFRFIPKNESEFTFRISIKEANDVLMKLE